MLEDSFKALSLGNSPVEQRLNRSMSYPDITPRKRITFKEYVDTPFPNHTFVRREISCEELDPDSSFKICRRVISDLYVNYSSPKPFDFHSKSSLDHIPSEPPESDMCAVSDKASSSLIHKRKRQRQSTSKTVLGGFKRQKLFEMSFKNDGEESKGGRAFHYRVRSCVIYSFVALSAFLIALFAYGALKEYSLCHVQFNLTLAKSTLERKVYGQEEGMRKLLDNLKELYTQNSGMRIFVFTGATGVGKTLTASILEEVFPWPHNVLHYIMPFDVAESEIPVMSHPLCGDNLLIIDDLKEEDVEMAIKIAEFVHNFYDDQRRIIVVFIFKLHQQFSGNVQNEDVVMKGQSIVSNLTEKGLVSELIHFKSLQKEDVIKCIRFSLFNNWITAKDEYVDMILQQVDYEKEGCKRISSKMAVLHELWDRDL